MSESTKTTPDCAHTPQLLLVDDDPLISEPLAFVLADAFDVHVVASRREAAQWLRNMGAAPELALVDLGLPPAPHAPDEGFALIEELLSQSPRTRVLVLSGQNDLENVKHALSMGAADFVPKPCEPNLLRARLDHQLLMLEAEAVPDASMSASPHLLGASRAMQDLRAQIEHYARTPFPVLVHGESGTGKELVAQQLHNDSDCRAGPYVTVNCAAFSAELLEAQLFGHARGAFTGATTARGGFFEEADGGTLFLDEIGEFPIALQPKLLRVIENDEYYRLGETRPRVSNVRIIAATNRDLQTEVREGRFRQDLFHRLGVLTVSVPPLRQRGRDRLELLNHFRDMYAAKVKPFVLDADAQARWLEYSFPGNVRELRNIVIRLGARYPGAEVGLSALEAELDSDCAAVDAGTIEALRAEGFRLDDVLSSWEQRYIDAALRLSDGNLSEAARLLGVHRTTLYSKIQRLAKERA